MKPPKFPDPTEKYLNPKKEEVKQMPKMEPKGGKKGGKKK